MLKTKKNLKDNVMKSYGCNRSIYELLLLCVMKSGDKIAKIEATNSEKSR
jgi:hypothetical protein